MFELIGKDCANIIYDYKNQIEEYERKIKIINNCLTLKNNKKYNININFQEFYEYYKTNYNFTINFQIKLLSGVKPNLHDIDKLNSTYFDKIKIINIQYKASAYDEYNNETRIFIFDFGLYLPNNIDIFQYITLLAIIETTYQDNIVSQYIRDNFIDLYNFKHMLKLKKEYVNFY